MRIFQKISTNFVPPPPNFSKVSRTPHPPKKKFQNNHDANSFTMVKENFEIGYFEIPKKYLYEAYLKIFRTAQNIQKIFLPPPQKKKKTQKNPHTPCPQKMEDP